MYNGWNNYETWSAALWIGSEPCSYDYWMDEARKAKDARELADQMRNEFEEIMPELPAGLWSDLLTAAFDEIEWYEIAKAKMDEVKEDEDIC